MTTKAKPIIKDKFWIVEQNGSRIGTISADDERYVFTSTDGVRYFDNKKQIERKLGQTVFETDAVVEPVVDNSVHGFPTSSKPYNAMLNVKQKLPLYTKSATSDSMYCAGYYVIRFDKGWVRSFCPKLSTLENYSFRGPFKTSLEMRQEMSNVKKS